MVEGIQRPLFRLVSNNHHLQRPLCLKTRITLPHFYYKSSIVPTRSDKRWLSGAINMRSRLFMQSRTHLSDLLGNLLQLELEEFRYLHGVRFAQSHLTTCDRDWFCPLLIAIKADRVCVCALNFICFHVLQLIVP